MFNVKFKRMRSTTRVQTKERAQRKDCSVLRDVNGQRNQNPTRQTNVGVERLPGFLSTKKLDKLKNEQKSYLTVEIRDIHTLVFDF